MNFWLVIIAISFHFSWCNCKKLTCNEVTDSERVNKDFKVSFKLFGIDSNDDLVEIEFSPTQKSKYFNPSLKTIVIIHGFTNNYEWVKLMANAWLRRVNFYLIH